MKKILCVDDDLLVLCLYQEELSAEGFKVILAEDGREALKKFEEEKPDVVVMDIRSPGTGGVETLARLRGKNRQLPIIIYTTHMHYRGNDLIREADAYLAKSSDLTELKEKISELLKNHRKAA